jgi:sporulation protein YlmC with PRC-barrel domain
MKTLSTFKGMRIATEEGMVLGHLADLRADSPVKTKTGTSSAQIRTLIYGVVGWLERFGLRATARQTIDWREVVRLEGDLLVVRNRKPPPKTRARAVSSRSRKRSGRVR